MGAQISPLRGLVQLLPQLSSTSGQGGGGEHAPTECDDTLHERERLKCTRYVARPAFRPGEWSLRSAPGHKSRDEGVKEVFG